MAEFPRKIEFDKVVAEWAAAHQDENVVDFGDFAKYPAQAWSLLNSLGRDLAGRAVLAWAIALGFNPNVLKEPQDVRLGDRS